MALGAVHPYLRFLRKCLSAPRLRPPPPPARLSRITSSGDLRWLLPFTYPIHGYRGRGFEERHLQLWLVESSQPHPAPHPVPQQAGHARPPTTEPAAPSQGLSHDTPSTLGTGEAAGSGHKSEAHSAAHAHSDAASGRPAVVGHNSSGGGPGHQHAGTGPHHTSSGGHAAVHLHAPSHPPLHLASHTPGQPHGHGRAPGPAPGPAQPPASFQYHPRFSREAVGQAHSYLEVFYPFTQRPDLWAAYHRPGLPGLDPALLIEDMDTFAADVAARHLGLGPLDGSDRMLMTATLERLCYHLHTAPGDGLAGAGVGAETVEEAAAEGSQGVPTGAPALPVELVDMRMSGQVTWVGRSSLEVVLQMTAAGDAPTASATEPATTTNPGAASASSHPRSHPLPSQTPLPHSHPAASHDSDPSPSPSLAQTVALRPGQLVASAEFLMALRDASLRRSVEAPPLHPGDALERELFRLGRERNRQRQARREAAAAAAAAAAGRGEGKGEARAPGAWEVAAALAGGAVPVGETEVHRSCVCRYEDRNTSGTIFGGHLLRLGYEAAAAAAEAHARAPCELLWLEETAITAPARVGDRLDAVGRVVWTDAEEAGAEDAGGPEAGVATGAEAEGLEEGARVMRIVVRVRRYDGSKGADPGQYVNAMTLAAAFLAPPGVRLRRVVATTAEEEAEAATAQRRHARVVAGLAAAEQGLATEAALEAEAEAAGTSR
ncbi:hypothetical protein HYH03_000237 [Edaphochlamys debaryana]|uniref:HotDog ACOT-type domain-containing protein n=1 Tax=Edaphochlamys debaryana TaxID=47281 RepID=A0A835YF38_9CHLO|nr:hypothetical protein HYH03_000237 [Edaphochlamys debaryana]|eukprot:KAG2501737.1 hypothetical protein HYH03_000237 [Edaphochlamys debaryana]